MPKFMLVQKGTRTWAGELFIFKHSFCGIELVRKLQSMDHFGVCSPWIGSQITEKALLYGVVEFQARGSSQCFRYNTLHQKHLNGLLRKLRSVWLPSIGDTPRTES